MNAQTPAGSRAADAFLPLPTSDVEGTPVRMTANGSAWDGAIVSSEGVTREGTRLDRETRPSSSGHLRPRSPFMPEKDIIGQLVDVLMDLAKDPNLNKSEAQCVELADAFRHAADLPPITKQSLSELDIQNIIANIKLRHDVSFDRDLSFRPNNEGPKGHHKQVQARKYWLALEAELLLYARLFKGTPPLRHMNASEYFKHAQRRVPKMFKTIHEVLKSLVPDRDHERVDEHLDVRMLMQEIEKGVCDMVALVEWVARLLKEHCAPMRDMWVDELVELMRVGATNHEINTIVDSLRNLLAMLETMKLDVANHQIRNLKPLLIEDTVTYEKHYHLDRLVKQRAKVNIDAAQKWWVATLHDFPPQSMTKDSSRARLESFARAVVSSLASRDTHQGLPDTFYLDADRLRVLKSEIEDLVHFEMCFTMFNQLLRDFGFNGTVSNATKTHLRSSLTAIIGESIGHGSQAWMYNSDSISLEIYRQARLVARRTPVIDHNVMKSTNDHLRSLFSNTFASHASIFEAGLLSLVLGCTKRNFNSSPTELYNSLVASPPPSSLPSFIPLPTNIDTFSFFNNTPQDRLQDLSKRISHIVLLHWRIWGPIAYVHDNRAPSGAPLSPLPPPQTLPQPAATPPAQHHAAPAPPSPPATIEQDVPVVNVMKTGEPPDSGSGYESSVSGDTRLP